MERNKKPEILYLHIYSNRYDIHTMNSDLPPAPRDWQCIATIAISPNVQFYAKMPNHYEPEIMVRGNLRRSTTSIETDFTIDLQDVGMAFSHHQTSTIQIGDTIDFWDGEFSLSISDLCEPTPPTKRN